jgi:mannose PTS system EIIA component
MVGILILTHGRMAEELLQAARNITGGMERFEALALKWSESVEEAESRVAAAIQRLEEGDGVLVMTDIFGGTPSNVAMRFMDPGHVEVISGVNLPMVVRLGCLSTASMPLSAMTAWIQEKGRSSICSSQDVPRPGVPLTPCET